MKLLTVNDIYALASLIRCATHREVAVYNDNSIEVLRGGKILAKVKITLKGKALATDIISGFEMIPHAGSWKWEIVI
jgi:hypothetical protein